MSSGKRDEWLSADDEALTRDCRFDFHRCGGKGGQKVNKTSSAVRLVHLPSGIGAVSSETRSQALNRHLAFRKLRMKLAFTFRETPEGKEIPDMKTPPSPHGAGYPLWTARLFDTLSACSWDLKQSAADLHCSSARLFRLLRRDPALWREYQASELKFKSRQKKDKIKISDEEMRALKELEKDK